MAKTPNLLNKSKLDNLRSSQKMWGDMKSVFSERIFSIRVLQNFYSVWKASSYTSAGYQTAMESVTTKDDPKTSINEATAPTAITEKTVQHWAADLFKKDWEDIKGGDVEANLNNISQLTGKLRELIAYQLDAGHEIDGLDSEIKDLETIMKNDK